MENSKTNEQVQRKGNNPEPAPKKIITVPQRKPIPDEKPLRKEQQRLND